MGVVVAVLQGGQSLQKLVAIAETDCGPFAMMAAMPYRRAAQVDGCDIDVFRTCQPLDPIRSQLPKGGNTGR